MKSPDGNVTNAIYGYTEFLIQVLKREKPTHLAVAFDGSLTTSFRNEIYPQYKAQRGLPPPELEAQLEACRRMTHALGMVSFVDDRFESDDLIGTLVRQLREQDAHCVIISSDKDFAQLVDDEVVVWDFARDVRYDARAVQEKFGVAPNQIVDLLALMGDSVDNVPGIKGVGPKTAGLLLAHFGSLEAIYAGLERVAHLPVRGAKSLRDKLEAGREMATLSRQLVTIATDVQLQAEIARLRYDGARRTAVVPVLETLGFSHTKDRIPFWALADE